MSSLRLRLNILSSPALPARSSFRRIALSFLR
jgi:hypothetical protein